MKFTAMTLLGLIFLTLQTFAAEEKADAAASKNSKSEVNCAQTDKNKLSIVHENGGCKVYYTKDNVTSVIGTQKSGTDFCERLYNKVNAKITPAECQK